MYLFKLLNTFTVGVLLIHEEFYLNESIFFCLKDQFPNPKSYCDIGFPSAFDDAISLSSGCHSLTWRSQLHFNHSSFLDVFLLWQLQRSSFVFTRWCSTEICGSLFTYSALQTFALSLAIMSLHMPPSMYNSLSTFWDFN